MESRKNREEEGTMMSGPWLFIATLPKTLDLKARITHSTSPHPVENFHMEVSGVLWETFWDWKV